jgi:peptidoglycan hydrolase-like protein with peptidoglycan-binding domain
LNDAMAAGDSAPVEQHRAPEPSTTWRGARGRRHARTVATVTTVVVVAVGAVAAAGFGFGGGRGSDQQSSSNLPPGRAQVTRQTMQDTDEVSGDLGFGATMTLPGGLAGMITNVPLAGDVVTRGKSIYRVDNTPVVLMYGGVPAYRALSTGSEGADVQQLEDNLRALGYTGITVDQRYTAATARAVQRWQKDQGLPRTGRVEQGRVFFAPGVIRVDSVTTGVNQSTGGGQEVLKYTETTRHVTVRLDVSKQGLARKGVAVQVQLPDGNRVDGRVERVYTVIEPAASAGADPATKIEAIISLSKPEAAAGIEVAVVTVVFTADEHKDVLTVPIAALVALADGGYGVEVVEGTTSRFVKVQAGMFADGRVEIRGDGLKEGMTVGIAQ